ncbi:MAG: long-chain fatty acid--CoA ligase [Deltaproteobacteria bacterium]|nr:long-chain fatty acid--CoA ligase [Deltaproteobacteria bacterium]
MGNAHSTLPQILLDNDRKYGRDKIAIREKDLGIWQSYSWADYCENTKKFALGLASLGFQRGDRLSVIGDNRPQLYWAQMAALCLGGIPVPLYQDAIEKELEYIIEHSEAKFIVAEDQEQVDKMLALKEKVSSMEMIIYDDPRGMRHYNQPFIKSFAEVQAVGLDFEKDHSDFFQKEVQKGSPEDTALIAYTSGTTGNPKGVVLTHSNLLTNVRLISKVEGYRDTDRVMAYLPMAWIGDSIYSLAMLLDIGFTINCPEAATTAMRDMREVGPTVVFCPPRIWENILTTIQVKMEDAAWIKQKMYAFLINVAHRVSTHQLKHQAVSLGLRFLYALGEFLVYGPLRDNLGMGRLRFAYTAGAALGPEVFQFYRSIGINLKQVYGLTETSAMCTYQPDGDVKLETVGIPCPGVEIKISEGGEVLIKSPGVFPGYYKNPEATSEALKDGWLYTGDAGIFDKDGHLLIIDRAKDVSKLANRTIFAPQFIENKLKFSPYIKEAVTLGQGQEYVTAMINIDLQSVGNWAERKNIGYTSYTDLSQRPEVYDLISNEVKKVNASLSKEEKLRGAQIRRFLILHKELDPDDAEVTRTRKIRRGFIAKKYAELIDALYSDKENVDVETKITYEDGRTANIRASLKIREAEIFQ